MTFRKGSNHGKNSKYHKFFSMLDTLFICSLELSFIFDSTPQNWVLKHLE